MDEWTDMHMNTTESMWYHMKASLNTIGKAVYVHKTMHSIEHHQVHKIHANYQAG